MAVFRFGPDGLLIIQALLVSILLAALAWRRVALSAAGRLAAFGAAPHS